MNSYQFTVSLRIRHPSADPADITAALDMAPKNAWKAGSPRRTPRDEPLQGTYRESYWSASLGGDAWKDSAPVALEPFLLTHLRALSAHAKFLNRLVADGGSCELFVELNGAGEIGLEMAPTLVRLLGDLQFTLSFDICADEEDEE